VSPRHRPEATAQDSPDDERVGCEREFAHW
jgi:hypothetical protein